MSTFQKQVVWAVALLLAVVVEMTVHSGFAQAEGSAIENPGGQVRHHEVGLTDAHSRQACVRCHTKAPRGANLEHHQVQAMTDLFRADNLDTRRMYQTSMLRIVVGDNPVGLSHWRTRIDR